MMVIIWLVLMVIIWDHFMGYSIFIVVNDG